MYLVVIDPQVALYRYLGVGRQLGYRLLVLAKDVETSLAGESAYNQELGINSTNADEFIQCDTANARAIVSALAPFQSQIAGIIPGDDPYVPATFEAGRMLGFDYAPTEDAICQQLKTAMKQRLFERGVPTAPFTIARSLQDAEHAWEAYGRDCMIKMVDYSASANVSRVTTREQLVDAWDAIMSNRLEIAVPFPLAQEAILERFVDGFELSAEGYVQQDRVEVLNYCEKITEENFVVVGHLLPADLTDWQELALEQTIKQCARALGIRNSLFHVEIHLSNGTPYVIECAARPPGQHIVNLISEIYGYDLMKIAIDLASGKLVEVQRRKPLKHFGLFALYSKRTGIFDGVDGLEALYRRGGVVRWHCGLQPGSSIERLSSFRQRYGFVILEAASGSELRENARWFRQNVHLRVANDARSHFASTQ